MSSTIEALYSRASEEGLSATSLESLIDIATRPNSISQGRISKLIRNLYPTGKIADAIVVKVISSLGHGRLKPSYSTQGMLLKWLIMVYDVLENPKILSQMYSVLFNLLDTVAIRPQLCHVLSLITRRRHVRPFRIQILMEVMRQSGNEAPLLGLLRIYKDYYPDVIIGTGTSGRASVFSHPNPEWRLRLQEIQHNHSQGVEDGLRPEERSFRMSQRNGTTKKRQPSMIPPVHTSHAHESSVTLEEIENAHDFVYKLEKIEPPNQLISVISDPLLHRFLQLKDSRTSSRRLDNWLYAFFEEQLEANQSVNHVIDMLRAIADNARLTQVIPDACLAYLKSILPDWDAKQGQESILDILSYTPMTSFKELYDTMFQHLEEAVLYDDSVVAKTSILDFYTKLHDRWSTSLLSQSTKTDTTAAPLASLTEHVNTLTLTILQSDPSMSIISSILRFYESVATLISHPEARAYVRIVLPSTELVYTLHFTNSLCTLSRLCSILALYKKSFEIAMAPKSNLPATVTAAQSLPYPKDYVNHFNGFLMDICNCIWRLRALNISDPNAIGCLISPTILPILTKYVSSLDASLALPSLFSLSFSPLLCLLAITYVRELEDRTDDEEGIVKRQAGPVTQNGLKQLEKDGGLSLPWADYKLGVLQYMEGKGAPGVGELMYNTMKHLMTAREAKAKA